MGHYTPNINAQTESTLQQHARITAAGIMAEGMHALDTTQALTLIKVGNVKVFKNNYQDSENVF